MDDNTRRDFTVNGFIFGSKQDVELAETELATVKYIDKKIENRSADTILSVYEGVVERRMFRTPVGYAYLHDLQKKMVGGGIPREKIPGVPLYQVYSSLSEENVKERTTVVPKKKKRDELKAQNRNLRIINVILVLLIIVLFVISLNGSAPTILNYRNSIQNEYSEWEQELRDRENRIRQKERELHMEYSALPEVLEAE